VYKKQPDAATADALKGWLNSILTDGQGFAKGVGYAALPTDLASKAFSSRSAISRRVDRMVEEGLVGRKSSDSDGRGVVVRLTAAGMARLVEAVPVHLKGVSKLFLERLDDQDLAVLERALDKVSLNNSYG